MLCKEHPGKHDAIVSTVRTNVVKILIQLGVSRAILKDWGVSGSVYTVASAHLQENGMALYRLETEGGRTMVQPDMLKSSGGLGSRRRRPVVAPVQHALRGTSVGQQ